jgi:hypothetical protein
MRHDIDIIRERILAAIPDAKFEQLQCTHPADDDRIWFVRREGKNEEVQLESSSYSVPFLIESTSSPERLTVSTIDEAVEAVLRLLTPLNPEETNLAIALKYACQGQSMRSISKGRNDISLMPIDWVRANIERIADSVLNLNDEWEYRRFLELCHELDQNLLRNLISRGLVSDNEEVREVAQDFLEK